MASLLKVSRWRQDVCQLDCDLAVYVKYQKRTGREFGGGTPTSGLKGCFRKTTWRRGHFTLLLGDATLPLMFMM